MQPLEATLRNRRVDSGVVVDGTPPTTVVDSNKEEEVWDSMDTREIVVQGKEDDTCWDTTVTREMFVPQFPMDDNNDDDDDDDNSGQSDSSTSEEEEKEKEKGQVQFSLDNSRSSGLSRKSAKDLLDRINTLKREESGRDSGGSKPFEKQESTLSWLDFLRTTPSCKSCTEGVVCLKCSDKGCVKCFLTYLRADTPDELHYFCKSCVADPVYVLTCPVCNLVPLSSTNHLKCSVCVRETCLSCTHAYRFKDAVDDTITLFCIQCVGLQKASLTKVDLPPELLPHTPRTPRSRSSSLIRKTTLSQPKKERLSFDAAATASMDTASSSPLRKSPPVPRKNSFSVRKQRSASIEMSSVGSAESGSPSVGRRKATSPSIFGRPEGEASRRLFQKTSASTGNLLRRSSGHDGVKSKPFPGIALHQASRDVPDSIAVRSKQGGFPGIKRHISTTEIPGSIAERGAGPFPGIKLHKSGAEVPPSIAMRKVDKRASLRGLMKWNKDEVQPPVTTAQSVVSADSSAGATNVAVAPAPATVAPIVPAATESRPHDSVGADSVGAETVEFPADWTVETTLENIIVSDDANVVAPVASNQPEPSAVPVELEPEPVQSGRDAVVLFDFIGVPERGEIDLVRGDFVQEFSAGKAGPRPGFAYGRSTRGKVGFFPRLNCSWDPSIVNTALAWGAKHSEVKYTCGQAVRCLVNGHYQPAEILLVGHPLYRVRLEGDDEELLVEESDIRPVLRRTNSAAALKRNVNPTRQPARRHESTRQDTKQVPSLMDSPLPSRRGGEGSGPVATVVEQVDTEGSATVVEQVDTATTVVNVAQAPDVAGAVPTDPTLPFRRGPTPSVIAARPTRRGQNPTRPVYSVASSVLARALGEACGSGDRMRVQQLLDAKASPNVVDIQTGETPLIIACLKGYNEIVELLLDVDGCDLNVRSRRGRTVLHHLVETENDEAALWMVKRGASLSIRDDTGKTPVDLSASFAALVAATPDLIM